jgi:hypothetical protein
MPDDPGTADRLCGANACHAPATENWLSGDLLGPPLSPETIAALSAEPPPARAPSGTPESVAQAWVAAGGRPEDIDRSLAPPDPVPAPKARATAEQRKAAEAQRAAELLRSPRTTAERIKGVAVAQGAPLEAVERPLTDFEVLLRTEPEVPLPNPRTGSDAMVPSRDVAPIVEPDNLETIGYGATTKSDEVWVISDVHGRVVHSGTKGNAELSDVQADDIVFVAWSAGKLATVGARAAAAGIGTFGARALPRAMRRLRNVAAAFQIGAGEVIGRRSTSAPVPAFVQGFGREAVEESVTRTVAAPTVRRADPVRAFQASRPKLDASPQSTAALEELFRRTSSGTRARATRAGEFLPFHTRGASSELKTIDELSERAEVLRIFPVPSSSAGRSPDFAVLMGLPDGSVALRRVEITTVTGSQAGYLARGAGGARATTATDIVRAVDGKIASRAGRPSQLVAPVTGLPAGGTLFVHLPHAGATAAADVAAAMARLAPRLARTTYVHGVEFVLPNRTVLRYVRDAAGAFQPVP